MKVIFAVNHPSQYHMFKNLARKIIKDNGDVMFFIQSRGIIEDLIESDGFKYRYSVSTKIRSNLKGKVGIALRTVITLISQELNLLLYMCFNKVDFLMGTDVAISHVGFLFRKKVFVFTDDDYYFIKPFCHLAFPLATHIVAAEVVDVNKWSKKQITYLGTQKNTYLHPKYFSPNPEVLDKYKLAGKRFFIIRLVDFKAFHDSSHNAFTGLSDLVIDNLLAYLEKLGVVIINIEKGLDSKYANYSPKIEPEDMHSLMFYSDLLIGDSQSMIIEAALLGTPAIRSNKWVVSEEKVSVIEYLEKKYSLFYSVAPNDGDSILELTKKLIGLHIKGQWKEKREKFFSENTNLTDFLFWIIKDYETNIQELKKNKDLIKEFSKL